MRRMVLAVAAVLAPLAALGSAGEIAFKDQELPTKLGVGYAVRLLDMNGDGRLDICVVDTDRIVWLANPNWEEHVLIPGKTKKDNVCFAPADIDGDGKIDFAVGAGWAPSNTQSGGTIQWIREGKSGEWEVFPIGEEPTVHRMNFADLNGDGKLELIVSPLHGRGTKGPDWNQNGVRLLSFAIPEDPVKGPWKSEVLNDDLHVTHNFQVTDLNRDGQPDILIVSFEGLHVLERGKDGKWNRTRIGTGNQETSPNKGASEVKHGRLAGNNDYIATIEPWHGHQVVVYTRPSDGDGLWTRTVLDEQLKWGHAVWCANLDDDEDEELIIGVRDNLDGQNRCGIRIYDPIDAAKGEWKKIVVDPGSVAVEDAAAGDLNGDGKIDVVAVGRATHNIKIYWNDSK